MSKTGFKIYAFTSDDLDQIEHAQNFYNWDISAFDGVYSDKRNIFATYLREDAFLLPNLRITDPDAVKLYRNVDGRTFPFGVCQPALLFFVGTETALSWSSEPCSSNYYGAKGRPVPKSVWKEVTNRKGKLDKLSSNQHMEPSNGSHLPKVMNYSYPRNISNCFTRCIIY
mmetsp:Transcript_32753/g.75376  ORF Transcript_32753/g.75376 Transcript_32753/m.75376 type:complete len:170 (+) Transcript_32753:147-656(+)